MKKAVIILIIIVFATDCNREASPQSFIELGKATVCGKITGVIPEEQKVNFLPLSIANCIVSDGITYDIPVNSDGTFSISVPVSYPAFGAILSNIYSGYIYLAPGEKTTLNIHFDEKGEKQVEVLNKAGYSAEDMINLLSKGDSIARISRERFNPDYNYKLSPHDFSLQSLKRIDEMLSLVDSDMVLSSKAKEALKNRLTMYYLQYVLLNYVGDMKITYLRNIHYRRSILMEDVIEEEPDFQEPDMSYYVFLKEFNLNDPKYVTCIGGVLEEIRKNKTFGIPEIGNNEPKQWVRDVQAKLKNVTGFDRGIFYELLLCSSYMAQLNKMEPFSSEQIKKIENYFKKENNKALSEILLAENRRILDLLAEDSNDKVAVKTMNDILAGHKGKFVIVDFWATWCGPCLKQINNIKPLKKEYENKDIVFVYIAAENSPAKAWSVMKKDIAGYHYYVSEEVWDQLLSEYDFNYIPTLLFFDGKGEFKEKMTGYRGKEKIKKTIEEYLN